MLHLSWNSTSNEPSLNKTAKSEEIFHLTSALRTQYLQNIVFYNDIEKSTKFFIINTAPMRQYLKRTVFKYKVWILRDFSPF